MLPTNSTIAYVAMTTGVILVSIVYYTTPFLLCCCCYILGRQYEKIKHGVRGAARIMEHYRHDKVIRLETFPHKEANILRAILRGYCQVAFENDVLTYESLKPQHFKELFHCLRLEHLRLCKAVEKLDGTFKRLYFWLYLTHVPMLCFTVYKLISETISVSSLSVYISIMLSQLMSVCAVSFFASAIHEKVNGRVVMVTIEFQ